VTTRKRIDVAVQEDHFERLARGMPPVMALAELIWNAVDGDATRVDVAFDVREAGHLAVVDAIRVADDGHGITAEDAGSHFAKLGGSWKSPHSVSRSRKRRLHGRAGMGRYAGFRLGQIVTWKTCYRDAGGLKDLEIVGRWGDLAHFEPSQPTASGRRLTGTEVVVEGLDREIADRLRGKPTIEALTRVFALYLRAYPDVRIFVAGEPLAPDLLIAYSKDYEIAEVKDDRGQPIDARLTVIEWTRQFDRLLLLCDKAGFTLAEQPAAIKAPGFNFTAFLRSDSFRDAGRQLDLANLNPPYIRLLDAARECMRDHFRARAVELHRNIVERLKDEGLYPWQGPPADPVENVERQVFDIVVANIDAHLPAFDGADAATKAFTLKMVKHAIEHGQSGLQRVFQAFVELPADKQGELAELIEKTSLAAIIDATQMVRRRLDFIAGLEKILFEPEIKKVLRERSQLHRILVDQTWIFGEEYALAVDDQDLTTVLRRHKALLGRGDEEDIAPVMRADGSRGIVDLMVSRLIRQPHPEQREHLVIELKAPRVKINGAIANQIESYAQAVARDDRFHGTKTRWSFWVVSNDMDEVTRDKVHDQPDRPDGMLSRFNKLHAEVWVKTWGEVIEGAKARLRFFEERLKYMADHDTGLDYLRKTYDRYLPSAAASKPPVGGEKAE